MKGIRCEHLRAEDAGRDKKHREKYDYVTARAVARLSVLSEYCLPLAKKGGQFIALKGSKFESVPVYTGRYGLGSKDTKPSDIIAVYRNMEKDEPKKRFTIGIVDDVTHLSLDATEDPDTAPAGTTSCKFWGLGSDGTVGANKNSIKIIGDHTDKYVQAYFQYDSKKTGGVTVSHLRFGDKAIKSPYYINKADFVACHNPSYITKASRSFRTSSPAACS